MNLERKKKTEEQKLLSKLRYKRKKMVCDLMQKDKYITSYNALNRVNASLVEKYPILKKCVDFQPDEKSRKRLL